MKYFYVILLFSPIISFGNAKNPYSKLKFDKLIMYDFSGGKGWNEYVVDKKGNLATSITQQVQLDVKSIANFNRLLGDKTSFGGAEASCFTPHLGLVYYRKDKIIAYITICLDCNVLISYQPILAAPPT